MAKSGTHKIILLGCVKQKLNRRAPARDLYVSDLFLKRRAYAEASGRLWFILSAKHGLVEPETPLEPYDEALNDMPRAAVRRWGENIVSQLGQVLDLLEGYELEIHAGKRYVEGIKTLLESRGCSVLTPLQGLRIGEQLQWYKKMNPAS